MKTNFEDIYRHIGFLFYGLAANRNRLASSEIVKLTDLVEKNWRQPGANGLNMHLVDCIHDGIRYANSNAMSGRQAVSGFCDYYKIHALPFSHTLKQQIIDSAALISQEFPRISQNGANKENLEGLMHITQRRPLISVS